VNGVSLPSLGAINQMMGGVTTYFDETGDGAAVFGARFDDYYWTTAEKSATTGKIAAFGSVLRPNGLDAWSARAHLFAAEAVDRFLERNLV
jgi:hypothetical protein